MNQNLQGSARPVDKIPNRAFFDAFIGTNPFELTHWFDGEVYGSGESWYVEVTLWGGPKIYDQGATWQEFTEAEDECERAYPVRLGPDQIREALSYIHYVAPDDFRRQRRLYLCRNAAYESGRWFDGHWQGFHLTRTAADQILQIAAMLYAGERSPQVLF